MIRNIHYFMSSSKRFCRIHKIMVYFIKYIFICSSTIMLNII